MVNLSLLCCTCWRNRLSAVQDRIEYREEEEEEKNTLKIGMQCQNASENCTRKYGENSRTGRLLKILFGRGQSRVWIMSCTYKCIRDVNKARAGGRETQVQKHPKIHARPTPQRRSKEVAESIPAACPARRRRSPYSPAASRRRWGGARGPPPWRSNPRHAPWSSRPPDDHTTSNHFLSLSVSLSFLNASSNKNREGNKTDRQRGGGRIERREVKQKTKAGSSRWW